MAPIKEVKNSPEVQEIMPRINRFYNALDGFRVNSAGSWLEAGEKIKLAKERIKEVKVKRKTFLDPISELKKNTMDFFDLPLAKLEQIVDKLGKKMAAWREEQLEKERIAQEKADKEAREKERVEKERLRQEAIEKERAAEQAREEAREAREKAEDLAKKENFERSERARIEAEEKEREAARLKEESKETRQEVKEVEVDPKEIRSKAGKIEGLHFRRYWKAAIDDEKKIPRIFLKPDIVAINEYVSKFKNTASIPGVKVYFEDKPVG